MLLLSKHTKTLDNIGKLKDGEYYKYDIKKGFTLVNPNEIIYKTHSINNLYAYYQTYVSLQKDLKELNDRLSNVIDVKDEQLKENIERVIYLLSTLKMNVENLKVISIDENGYVDKFLTLNGIITLEDIKTPLDVDLGYYKAILKDDDIVLVLDKIKYESEWL